MLTLAAQKLQYSPAACGILRKHFTKPFSQPAAQTVIFFQYLGDWYAQLTVAAPFNPEGVRCTRAQYGLFDNGTLSVYNTGTLTDGSFNEICGWAEQADPKNAPGDLTVYFYGNPGNYWILDTDFESFTAVYSCADAPLGMRSELAWILTREQNPTDDTVNMK